MRWRKGEHIALKDKLDDRHLHETTVNLISGARHVKSTEQVFSLTNHEVASPSMSGSGECGRGDTGPNQLVRHHQRTTSCPPSSTRSVTSGPWSLEWMNDHDHGDAGVLFSASKKIPKMGRCSRGRQLKDGHHDHKKRKSGGLLRHSIYILKKVALLPVQDRTEIVRILKKKCKQRGGSSSNRSNDVRHQGSSEGDSSSSSVHNDWEHWVTMHGNDNMAVNGLKVLMC
jgi:hypothetical protein